MIKVALLTTDSREHFKDYANPNPYFGTAPEALIEGFKHWTEDVEVHIVSCLQELPASSPARLADNIYYHALHVPKIGWMRTGYQGCIRAVRRKLREIQPQIVHGQGTERDCAICAVYSGYPNVLTIHGNMRLIADFLASKPFSYYWVADKLERLCLQRTSGVVAISTYTQSNVAGVSPKTWLLHNAVHPSYFDVARRLQAPQRVLCVAHVGVRKNQITLIEALDELSKRRALNLRFAGTGSPDDRYFSRFSNRINDRVWCNYLGTLDRPKLQEELAAASLLVLPSLEDNCPMVVLEAAAAGVPVAASAVGGIPDLVSDGETGLLFDPRDGVGIRHAVQEILQNHSLASHLSKSAREVCRRRFSCDRIAEKHLQIYREVLGFTSI